MPSLRKFKHNTCVFSIEMFKRTLQIDFIYLYPLIVCNSQFTFCDWLKPKKQLLTRSIHRLIWCHWIDLALFLAWISLERPYLVQSYIITGASTHKKNETVLAMAAVYQKGDNRRSTRFQTQLNFIILSVLIDFQGINWMKIR